MGYVSFHLVLSYRPQPHIRLNPFSTRSYTYLARHALCPGQPAPDVNVDAEYLLLQQQCNFFHDGMAHVSRIATTRFGRYQLRTTTTTTTTTTRRRRWKEKEGRGESASTSTSTVTIIASSSTGPMSSGGWGWYVGGGRCRESLTTPSTRNSLCSAEDDA